MLPPLIYVLLLSLLITSTFSVPTTGHDAIPTLPKRASLQQVLTFLRDMDRLMKETHQTYRLHKRGACCGNDVVNDEMDEELFSTALTLHEIFSQIEKILFRSQGKGWND